MYKRARHLQLVEKNEQTFVCRDILPRVCHCFHLCYLYWWLIRVKTSLTKHMIKKSIVKMNTIIYRVLVSIMKVVFYMNIIQKVFLLFFLFLR